MHETVKCATCHGELGEHRAKYKFPKEFGCQLVFCCYDCMCAWMYRNLIKTDGIEKKKDLATETEKDAGEWF